MNEFVIKNGYVAQNNSVVSGSLTVSNGITGDVTGTASFATTASYAMNAGAGAGFPYSGSAVITGSLFVSGSGITGSLSGSLIGTASYATQALSSSFATYAISASNAPGFTVQYGQSTPAATWSFTHNLNTRNPIVQVYDSTYKQIIPNEIVATSGLTAEIRFDYAESGYAVFSNGGGLYITGSTSQLNQDIAAVTWSFTHNLNSKYVNFEVYDSNDLVIIPAGIRALNTNQAELYFGTPQTGIAVANFSGISGSTNAVTASYALTATSSSYATVATTATTASFANAFTVAGTLTAQTLVVQTITSSVDFVTGSTRFGTIIGNTHQFTGSVGISGSTTLTGALSGTSATFSGNVEISGSAYPQLNIVGNSSTTGGGVRMFGSTTQYAEIYGEYESSNNGQMFFRTRKAGTITTALQIASTGAATFSSTIDAASRVLAGSSSNTSNAFSGINNSAAQATIYSYNHTASGWSIYSAQGINYFANNVGIGTSSPSGAAGVALAINGGASQTRIALKNNVTGDAAGDGFQIVLDAGGQDVTLEQRENAVLAFATNATERMRITSGGNVGIGTSSPSSYAGANLAVVTSTAGNMGISIDNTYTATSSGTASVFLYNGGLLKVRYDYARDLDAGIIGTVANIPMLLFAGGSERMRITSVGDLFVGTTVSLGGGGTEGTNGFRVSASGTLVNNSTSDYAAYWAKRSGYSFGGYHAFYNAGTQIGRIITNNGSSVSYETTSDYRLKEDLKQINALEKVTAINVYDFKWKNTNNREYGVLAHELQEVIPYVVSGEKDGKEMQGVDYSKIVPILVKAIQEQQQQIEELKFQNTILTTRIEQLEQ